MFSEFLRGTFLQSFNRQVIGMCNGLASAEIITFRRESGARYYDVDTGRYVYEVTGSDQYGRCVVRYIQNGVITSEDRQFPNILSIDNIQQAIRFWRDGHKVSYQ